MVLDFSDAASSISILKSVCFSLGKRDGFRKRISEQIKVDKVKQVMTI